jgi:hypothetical protein
MVNFLLFIHRVGGRDLDKLKPYVGPSVSGFIWGSIAFIAQALLRAPGTHPFGAFQELAIWSIAGAMIAFAIAFVGDQFA